MRFSIGLRSKLKGSQAPKDTQVLGQSFAPISRLGSARLAAELCHCLFVSRCGSRLVELQAFQRRASSRLAGEQKSPIGRTDTRGTRPKSGHKEQQVREKITALIIISVCVAMDAECVCVCVSCIVCLVSCSCRSILAACSRRVR